MQRPNDPEVIADLRHRDASERDHTRSALVACDDCGHHVRDHDSNVGPCSKCACTEFVRKGGPMGWRPPVIVERWPCTSCNALVDMPLDAIEQHAAFNRLLAKRGDRPLAKRIPCGDCKRREDEERVAKLRPHEQLALDEPRRTRP
jgi:hypothetical protein